MLCDSDIVNDLNEMGRSLSSQNAAQIYGEADNTLALLLLLDFQLNIQIICKS